MNGLLRLLLVRRRLLRRSETLPSTLPFASFSDLICSSLLLRTASFANEIGVSIFARDSCALVGFLTEFKTFSVCLKGLCESFLFPKLLPFGPTFLKDEIFLQNHVTIGSTFNSSLSFLVTRMRIWVACTWFKVTPISVATSIKVYRSKATRRASWD